MLHVKLVFLTYLYNLTHPFQLADPCYQHLESVKNTENKAYGNCKHLINLRSNH